ncbi:hypothetical protein [Nitrosospira sp. NRS527]|uniref:hypothetical protein n=1 Tax=Nitrosospira sp. NRS527 TaxID=155925 RepID=UPI001AF1A6DA|nr:hypothetical protein [Nitrosospira sp. NRS527]BCT67896.1 hypothetical protein NNRS527_01484 [Nitrosospira sp. NRS527]
MEKKNQNNDVLIDLQKNGQTMEKKEVQTVEKKEVQTVEKKEVQTMEKILLFCYNSILLYWTGWVAYGLATNLATYLGP